MDEQTIRAELAAAQQQERRRRRAKRGVVAGYLHEISARHRTAGAAERAEAALAAAVAHG